MIVRRVVLVVLPMCVAASVAITQVKLNPNNIPPNFGTYTLDPEYTPGAVLGWAEQRIEEKIDRGLVAICLGEGKVYLSWRLLKSDSTGIAFNVYRSSTGGSAVKLNAAPVLKTTDFTDAEAPLARENAWWVRPIVNGKELPPSSRATLPADPPVQQYLSFRIREDIPAQSVHKIGIGDLDGDGEYEYVIKRPNGPVDPGTPRRSPDTFKVEAYQPDGTFMWRNDLGWSIELGIWYSPMIVWDLNGDGRAEVALKTGEGDTRSENGQVLTGPEYVSVWDGMTGKEIAKADWIARGSPTDWGDRNGNRMNRNMIAVAYLDGKTPSLLVVRGIYGLMKMDAWLLRGNKLEKAWSWSNFTSGWKYQGQGGHTAQVADIDGDGHDEVLNGSIAIDHDGKIMWSTGLGHGDRFYVGDIDPDHPGLEVFYVYEDPHPQNGVSVWDARTGDLLWGLKSETKDNQVGRGLCGDIDSKYPGLECWGDKYFFTAKGSLLSGPVPSQDGLVWWDADLLRELQSRGTVSKWNGPELTKGIEGQVMAWADVFGDWREEIITYRNGELRIYTTVIPASDRRVSLMQDPLYRSDVALKSMGYDQVPMTSYYLGTTQVNVVSATK